MGNSNTYQKIGSLIRQYRVASKMSQLDLAQKLGYNNPQFVSLFERGFSKVPLETLGQLIIILGIPEDQVSKMLISAAEQEITSRLRAGKKLSKKA